MSFYVKLINLALLFSSAITVSASGTYYKCGDNIIKQNLFDAAVQDGCSRYHNSGVCAGVNCVKPNRLPAHYQGNLFPTNYGTKIMWPIKKKRMFVVDDTVGFAVMDITGDKCAPLGAIYRLKNTNLDLCEGPFTSNSINSEASFQRSGSGNQRDGPKKPYPGLLTPGGTVMFGE